MRDKKQVAKEERVQVKGQRTTQESMQGTRQGIMQEKFSNQPGNKNAER